MRPRVWMAAVVLGLAGAAKADEPHYAPVVGTTATFRLMTTNNFNGQEVTFGQLYRLTTTAANGAVSESTITPLALIMRCPDSETSTDCRQARNFPDVTRDGDLYTIPIPPEAAANMAKTAKLTARDFVRYTQVFPLPGAEDIEETAKPKIGATPMWVQTNTTECDDALDKFFPLGALASLTVTCRTTAERSQGRVPYAKDAKTTLTDNIALSFVGREHVAAPAGDFAVASVHLKASPVSGDGPVSEGDWAFIESLGISARSALLVHYPNGKNTSHFVRELITLGP